MATNDKLAADNNKRNILLGIGIILAIVWLAIYTVMVQGIVTVIYS